MKKVRIIGDVHGHTDAYVHAIIESKRSYCVGDFGFERQWNWLAEYIPVQHKTIMGNHDYHPVRTTHSHSIGNWNCVDGMFFIAGAKSIDAHLRTEGVDWFRNEELNYQEAREALDAYVAYKPRIVITHDAPQSVIEAMFKYAWMDKSMTTQMLQIAFELHQPEFWFFGHHHKSAEVDLHGTKFRCLDELEFVDIEI